MCIVDLVRSVPRIETSPYLMMVEWMHPQNLMLIYRRWRRMKGAGEGTEIGSVRGGVSEWAAPKSKMKAFADCCRLLTVPAAFLTLSALLLPISVSTLTSVHQRDFCL